MADEDEERIATLRDVYKAVIELGIVQLSQANLISGLINHADLLEGSRNEMMDKFFEVTSKTATALDKLLALGIPK